MPENQFSVILLHHEQGLGDTIQAMRYAPLVGARGGRVTLEVQPMLARLAASLDGLSRIIAAGAPLPEFDCHCPLFSLPRLFGTELATIPANVPYLSPDPAAVEHWRRELGNGAGLRVGLVWAGNPGQQNDRNRSIGLDRLLPVLEIPGIRWFSLQVGDRAGAVARLPRGVVTDLSTRLTDVAETAAVIANLDLVLTVCTSVAHLAGRSAIPCG